ncbi:hypothetical protein, partial [Bifidobacterium merycicum]|uniref:hypothetical protein n=1 Tax=Bifidobacterium merycicum TaxID=78345 RepID=UPI0019553719
RKGGTARHTPFLEGDPGMTRTLYRLCMADSGICMLPSGLYMALKGRYAEYGRWNSNAYTCNNA